MRKLVPLILSVLVAALFAREASGQTCLGLPSFESSPVHLSLAGEFPDSATAYVAGIGAGLDNGLFSNIGVGRISYEGLDEDSTLGFIEFGLQFPIGRFQFCPILGGYLGIGPDDAIEGIEVTSRAATGGGALSLPLNIGTLLLVPNLAIKYEYFSQKVVQEAIGSASYTFNFTTLDAGLALVIRDRFGIQPVFHIPLSGEDDETSYGVYASIDLGWPWH